VAVRFLHDPLPVTPVPCGQVDCEGMVKSWQARGARGPGQTPAGEGVTVIEDARAEFAAAPWTLECWVAWPEGSQPLRQPATVAEASGEGWSWELGFDHAGALKLAWRSSQGIKVVAGDILTDSLLAGRWYHVAAVMLADGACGLYVTEAGEPIARRSGEVRKIDLAPWGPGGMASLSIGRPLAGAEAAPFHIGSAAFRSCACGPADFPALGGAALPEDVRLDQNIEYGAVGRAFALAKDTIAFAPDGRASGWFAFRVRAAQGRTLRFHHLALGPMGVSVFVSEDGGETWAHPSGGAWRSFAEGELWFTHTFGTDEAIFAASPPVTVGMAEEWIDQTAARLRCRVHEVGTSRGGRSLRVIEAGNVEAPIVYLQAGQHNMTERLGYFMVTSAFEAAAGDAELMSKTRWMAMPLVNVDSYGICREDGNLNRFWGKTGGPPTVRALEQFLRRETERTGGVVMLDWHAGTVWRGHTILCESDEGFSDPQGNWESLNLKRESGFPQFEACLRAEGLNYTVLNGRERNLPTYRQHGFFEDLAVTLPGVKAPLCVELSAITADTPEGVEPVSVENLRADGVRWYRAIRRFVLGE